MKAVGGCEVATLLGGGDQHIGIVVADEPASFFRLFTDDDILRMLEHDAE